MRNFRRFVDGWGWIPVAILLVPVMLFCIAGATAAPAPEPWKPYVSECPPSYNSAVEFCVRSCYGRGGKAVGIMFNATLTGSSCVCDLPKKKAPEYEVKASESPLRG